jgi:predicted transposase/invertase (TIGR01784 family)
VEFDFRCKIENSFVILDMQQWYKRDVTHRFYLYHALNTGLQLEELSNKRVLYDHSYQKTKKVKDYRALLPVLTLVWMSDEAFGLRDDYAAYTMTPELVTEFIKKEKLWHKPEIIEILKERARVLELLDNQNKDLYFLSKNRLIFLRQRNIVKNKTNAKYRKWFEFAEKTKNPDNKEEDFQEYMNDEIFVEIMKRINKKELTEDDFLYIENEREIREEVERYERQIYEDGQEEGIEKGIKQGEQRGKKRGEKIKAVEIATRLKVKGFDDEIIAEVTGLTPVEITQL